MVVDDHQDSHDSSNATDNGYIDAPLEAVRGFWPDFRSSGDASMLDRTVGCVPPLAICEAMHC